MQPAPRTYCNHNKLIIHCCYHKVGTHWFHNIFSQLSKLFTSSYQYCQPHELKDGTEFYLDDHSRHDLSVLRSYIGSHMIRDPRDVIVSGYFYHLWCDESWCTKPLQKLNDQSYQQVLQSLNQEDGIMFELEHEGAATLRAMRAWDYSNPLFLELRYEKVITDEPVWFKRIFQHYGFTNDALEIAMGVAQACTFTNVSGRNLGTEERRSYMRNGKPGDWKNYFTDTHKKRFKKLFPQALQRLGYEKDGDW